MAKGKHVQTPPPSVAEEGHYKKYNNWVLEVTTEMKNVHGTRTFSKHTGRFVEIAQKPGLVGSNIVIEPERAEHLNKFWHNRKHYLLEAGEPKPKHIIRVKSEVEGKEFEDTIVYE